MKTIDSIAYRDFSCPVTLSIVGPWKEEKNLSFVEVKIFTRCAISMLDFYAMNSGRKIVQKHKKIRASNIKYVKNISFLFIRKNVYTILKLHIMYYRTCYSLQTNTTRFYFSCRMRLWKYFFSGEENFRVRKKKREELSYPSYSLSLFSSRIEYVIRNSFLLLPFTLSLPARLSSQKKRRKRRTM